MQRKIQKRKSKAQENAKAKVGRENEGKEAESNEKNRLDKE